MTFSQNAVSSTVAIVGTVTANGVLVPATGQTIKSVHVNAGTGANQTAATITAGKTGYLFAANATIGAADTPTIKTNADATIFYLKPVANGSDRIVSNIPLAVYQAGENIRISMAATSSMALFWIEV